MPAKSSGWVEGPIEPKEVGADTTSDPNLLSAMSMGQKTILVVEDVEFLRTMLKRILVACGYHVVEAQDAHIAFQAVVNDGLVPDLALVDYSLPGTSGAQLVKSLRDFDVGRGFPVIGMSANSHPDAEREFRAMGCHFLGKPFRLQELVSDIRCLLDECVCFETNVTEPLFLPHVHT